MKAVRVSQPVLRKMSEIVFRDDLYPRIKTSAETVQKYAEDLSVLPAIEVNQHNELIDGWHRWTAHKKANTDVISVIVTPTSGDADVLEMAIERNAAHGLQLSQEDKRHMARQIYASTALAKQGERKKRLAHILSVDISTIQKWLSRIDKDNKEKRDCAVRDLYTRCYTQDEIAELVGMPQGTIKDILVENGGFRFPLNSGDLYEIDNEEDRWNALEQRNRANAEHRSDFEIPIYNVWKQQEKTREISHFGNTEVRWVDNLLYLYTKPFDIVVDPFAGSGSTLDICRKRFRRCWVSDRLPIVERENEIRKWDLTDGLPALPRWKDVGLVYLDPPYWRQAEGEYSNDPVDLANMPLDQFNQTLSGIIHSFGKKLSNAYIALVMSPTQWSAPEHTFTDHIADFIRFVKLPIEMRFSVPYESQQCNAQMVEWAKTNRQCLVLTREIIVWRIP